MQNAPLSTVEILAEDLLDGVPAFSAFTGFTERRLYYLLEHGQLPGGKLGKKWTGSKTAVREFLTNLTRGQRA